MNMYRDDGTKIGTKTINRNVQRVNGNVGNDVSMKFKPPAQQTQRQPQQQNHNNSYATMKNGVTAPKIQYEAPKGDENFSRILRNLATSRNAKSQQQYDKMNMNLFNQNADRTQRANQNRLNRQQKQKQYNSSRQDQNNQFDRTMDFNAQKQKQINALKNVMTPYQKQQMQQKQYDSRIKNFDEDGFRNQMPENVSDNIGDRDFEIAKQQFLKTGIMPQFEKYDGGNWIDDDYRVSQDQAPIAEAPKSSQASSDPAKDRAYRRWVEAKHNKIMDY